ncbi:imidazolonepropionase, partial [Burkholderia cenocepacia]
MKPTVWHHLRLCPHGHPDETIDDAAIAVDETGTIAWLGALSALPHGYAHWRREALHGARVTPGLVDCHPHPVYGGTRACEFAKRRAAVVYEAIAPQGTGVV